MLCSADRHCLSPGGLFGWTKQLPGVSSCRTVTNFPGFDMAMQCLQSACYRQSLLASRSSFTAAALPLRAGLQPRHLSRLQVQQRAVGKHAAQLCGPGANVLAAASTAVRVALDKTTQCMPAVALAVLWVSTADVLQTLLRSITAVQHEPAWH